MLPIIRPLLANDLSEEDFYSLGRTSLLSRFFSAWSSQDANRSVCTMIGPHALRARAGLREPQDGFNGC